MERPSHQNVAGAAVGSAGAAAAASLRILGVDPGSVALGWGVIDSYNSARLARVASGTIRGRGERAARLAAICDAIQELCERFRPAVLSLEQSFVGDNVQSAFRLGEVRGAVMVAAGRARVAVAEYSPAQIKLAVAGSGRAAKAQMQAMVSRLLAVDQVLGEDEADALGAAICHVNAGQFAALVAAASTGWGGAGRGRRTSRRR